MASHAPDTTDTTGLANVRARALPRTAHPLTSQKADARVVNASLLDEVMTAHAVSNRATAARMGVSEDIVRDARTGLREPLTIVDFLPTAAARDLWIRKAQMVDSAARPTARPEVLALLVSHRNGELDGAIAVALANDGEIDDEERLSILPLAAALETRAHDLVLCLGASR